MGLLARKKSDIAACLTYQTVCDTCQDFPVVALHDSQSKTSHIFQMDIL